MSDIRFEKVEVASLKAQIIRDNCLRERQEARERQISANAEVRISWKESDNYSKAGSVTMPIVSGESNERTLGQTPKWLQCLSNGISQRVQAVAGRLQVDRTESTTYLITLVQRIATGG